ncbi:YceI family protein [Mycobacterium sp. JS623]|uniref:YceI family protein n=1 Tax=Mycobacterium sp. JS623 TaxID=212767 RepID=UPI00059D06CA
MTTAVTNPIGVGTWPIDPVHSSIDFSTRPLMVSMVHGRFETISGTITIAPDSTAAVRRK